MKLGDLVVPELIFIPLEDKVPLCSSPQASYLYGKLQPTGPLLWGAVPVFRAPH